MNWLTGVPKERRLAPVTGADTSAIISESPATRRYAHDGRSTTLAKFSESLLLRFNRTMCCRGATRSWRSKTAGMWNGPICCSSRPVWSVLPAWKLHQTEHTIRHWMWNKRESLVSYRHFTWAEGLARTKPGGLSRHAASARRSAE